MASLNISINDWRNSVLWCENLNITHKAVACAICSFYRPDKHCFPSYTTLCEMLNVSRATISASIKSLVKYKFLEVKKGEIQRLSSLTNFYVFVGVNDSSTNSSDDSLYDSSTNSSDDSLPSELEIENKGNKGNITSQDKSCSDVKKKTKKEISEEVKKLFEKWWNIYPNKKSKPAALEKFNNLLAEKTVTFDELMKGAIGYSDEVDFEKTETKYIKHPTTWLNQGCWADEYKKHSYFTIEGF